MPTPVSGRIFFLQVERHNSHKYFFGVKVPTRNVCYAGFKMQINVVSLRRMPPTLETIAVTQMALSVPHSYVVVRDALKHFDARCSHSA